MSGPDTPFARLADPAGRKVLSDVNLAAPLGLLDLLRGIQHLLYGDGYTIKGVQKLLSATRGNLSVRLEGGAPPAKGGKKKEEPAEDVASFTSITVSTN